MRGFCWVLSARGSCQPYRRWPNSLRSPSSRQLDRKSCKPPGDHRLSGYLKRLKPMQAFHKELLWISVLFWLSEVQNITDDCDYCEPDAAYSEKARPGAVPGSGHGQGWTWEIQLAVTWCYLEHLGTAVVQKSQSWWICMNSVKDIPPLPCLVITDKLILGSQAYQQALKAAERQASLQHACHFISTLHLMGI